MRVESPSNTTTKKRMIMRVESPSNGQEQTYLDFEFTRVDDLAPLSLSIYIVWIGFLEAQKHFFIS